jgi:hypothetical protein
MADEDIAKQLELIKESLVQKREEFDLKFEDKKRKLTQGDELPPGVQKMVKVYLAVKRRLQPVTRWPVVTVTRVWYPASCRSKTCLTWATVVRSTSC